MKLNQKGITLVELIAALALVGVIAVIAWTAMSIGFQHSASETSKTHLQQEANLIIATLSSAHRQSDYYYLNFENGKLYVKTCPADSGDSECNPFRPVSENNYSYSGTIDGIAFTSWNENCEIDLENCKLEPKKAHVAVSLQVASPNNPNNSVSVQTVLTRILTGNE